jgi:hypothetical protein
MVSFLFLVWVIFELTPKKKQSLYCLICTMSPKVENHFLCVCVLYLGLNSGPQKHLSMCKHIFYVWYFSFLFFIFLYRNLNSRPTSWATPPVLHCDGFFWKRVFNYLPMLAWTAILLMSSSWVARITSVSHWHPAYVGYFKDKVLKTIFWSLHRNLVLMISTSWIARIIGVSHNYPTHGFLS